MKNLKETTGWRSWLGVASAVGVALLPRFT